MQEHKGQNTEIKPNKNQQVAIDAIEGPVMVIAGPGTGKTELLSKRIQKILETTDAGARHILCMTYTEAGTVAMRQRLLQHIGPEAYNVHIHTFHGFCNMVIQENLDLFGDYQELQPLSDLEEVMLYNEMIDGFPIDHPFRKVGGREYYFRTRLKKLFDTMKQENWSPDYVRDHADAYIKRERDSEEYMYKRNSKYGRKGDFNERKFEKDVLTRMNDLKAGAAEFDRFQQMLKENGRYDYHDMLRWVNRAFRENQDLLADYQERYLYILVDEFQDTNGIQVSILNQLAGYWDQPNLFVVGDDDQAIYRFQGANMENMTLFIEKYRPEVIILEENYRSSQHILNVSMKLIAQNESRLIKLHQNLRLSKDLNAFFAYEGAPEPRLVAYQNEAHEYAAIAKMIIEAAADPGRELNEIAVIYRSHAQVADIVKALESRGIPLNIRKRVDILSEPLIMDLVEVMKYISAENTGRFGEDYLLFRMMHFRFWGIVPADAAALLLAYRKYRDGDDEQIHPNFRTFLEDGEALDSVSMKDRGRVDRFVSILTTLQMELNEVGLQTFFERLIYRSGLMEFALSSNDRTWYVQLITTLFDFIKGEMEKDPELTLDGLLEILEMMSKNEVQLPVQKIIQSEKGVNFVTAHSAKGLEFREVFLMGCRKDKWESNSGGRNSFKYPDTLTTVQSDYSDEDERRLFYVAMTRAKEKLVISYAMADNKGTPKEASRFFTELNDLAGLPIERVVLSEADYINYFTDLFTPSDTFVPMIDRALVDRILEKFELSVTTLNKYLECPRAFYFETILRVPAAKAAHMGFGSAIHFAFEQYFKESREKSGADEHVDRLLLFFKRGMDRNRAHFSEKEYRDRLEFGEQILRAYWDYYGSLYDRSQQYELELKIKNVAYEGIPIKGQLDKVIIGERGVSVVDYKTGKYDNGRSKLNPPKGEKPGGNYWRQIVFYKMLTLADKSRPWVMDEGVIDFVQPQKDGTFKRVPFHISSDDLELVTAEMQEAYRRIRNHEFQEGCEECEWCKLVNNHFVLDASGSVPKPDADD